HQATDPMHKAFEEFLDTYLCVTHGALTTMHKGGSNYNAANLAALVLDTMGLDAETYSVVINGDISDPGVGIGQFCGAGGVEIYVKNNVTGEETEHETISVSSRKLNHVEYDGTICLYTCPEDSVVWKPAEEILDRYVCTDDSYEDPIIHALFPDEASFTEENFVALIAAELGAVEGHQIQVTKFDPARLNTDSTCRVYVYKWNDNVLEATNEISFICSTADVDAPTLSADHYVPKTLEDFIDERIAELACAAHHDVNLQFGTGSTVTPETLSALLTEIFGYKAEVASDDAYAGARGAYGDEGDGSTVAFDVNVTFTDEETGETCTKLVELAIRKDLLAKYSGAVEYGALSVCPDELPDDIKAAQEAIGALPGEITLEGKVFNETVIENWYREVTGLTGGEWEFFMANFDAEAAYSGNEVIVVLKNVNVNDEGRTYTVGAEKVLKIDTEAVDPMHAKFEAFLDEYLCVTHGALTTMHKGGGNYNAANLGALVISTMGLDPTIYSAVINGDISDPGVGIGQFCGAGNVEIYIVNNVTGEETEHETINTSSRKLNHVAYDGTICLYTCPEDSEMWKPAEEILGGLICADDSHGDPTIHALFPNVADITQDNLATAVLAALDGIEGAEVGFSWFEDGYAGVYLTKWNGNVLEATNVFEVVSSVSASVDAPVLSAEHPVPDPMHVTFEEFLDEYLCVTHGALTTMHKGGGNYNASNLAALVLDTMGLDAETYSVVINGDISDPGVGIGQFCGASNVEIYVKNNTTGEETEHQTINTSSRKLNHVAYDGVICFYTCPEDSEMWKPAEETLGGFICADDSHEDPTIHALFPDADSITEDNLAAAVLAALEGIEGAEVGFAWYEDGYAGVYLVKWNENVLEATNVFEIVSSVDESVDAPVLSTEHPVPVVPPAPPTYMDIDYDVATDKQGDLINDGAAFNAWVLEYITSRFEFPQDSIEINNYSALKSAYDDMMASGDYSAATTISLTYHSSDASAAAVDATYNFYFVGGPYVEATSGDGPALPAMTCDIEFNVRHVEPSNVAKDGVISEGEYYRCLAPKAELFGAKTMTGDKLTKYQQMVDTSKFYFSWDEEHGFNIAVEMIAPDLLQLNSADVFDGRLEPKEGDDPDNFVGPCDGFMDQLAFVFQGVADASGAHGFYYAFGRNTETGEYLRGHWFGSMLDGLPQYGYNASYYPVEDQDMVISYGPGNKVVFEYSLPLTTLFPAEMINSDGTIVNGSKYNYNMTITNGWNETTHTIANSASDYNAEMVPLKFGDLGAWLDWRQGKWNGKTVKRFNRPAVLTFINEG
ncbi:MAG: hypothetical protein IKI91_06080, partial [Clostridia bacterium]|nr:hypothetical protein [Clostridia bacterium]